MNSIATAKDKELSVNDVGHQYNFQHLVFVTKYRYKMFGKSKTIEVCDNVAERYKMIIKELSFGDHLLACTPFSSCTAYEIDIVFGTLTSRCTCE